MALRGRGQPTGTARIGSLKRKLSMTQQLQQLLHHGGTLCHMQQASCKADWPLNFAVLLLGAHNTKLGLCRRSTSQQWRISCIANAEQDLPSASKGERAAVSDPVMGGQAPAAAGRRAVPAAALQRGARHGEGQAPPQRPCRHCLTTIHPPHALQPGHKTAITAYNS